tara:strand:+ start:257 stop:577 length:321 start_codon:yes stop_codon:yes gene_type:complete
MALFMYSLDKATENKRRQATARRREKTPHIELARIDYMALYAIARRRIIAPRSPSAAIAHRRYSRHLPSPPATIADRPTGGKRRCCRLYCRPHTKAPPTLLTVGGA